MEKVLIACVVVCVAWYALAGAVAWIATRYLKATPRRVAAGYAVAIAVLGSVGAVRWWAMGIPVAGDSYDPYIVAGGPVVGFAVLFAQMGTEALCGCAGGSSMVLWNLVVPGAWFVLLGGVQWYALAWLAARWGGKGPAAGAGRNGGKA